MELIIFIALCGVFLLVYGLIKANSRPPEEEAKANRDVQQYNLEANTFQARQANIPHVVAVEREELMNKQVTARKDSLIKMGVTEDEITAQRNKFRHDAIRELVSGDLLFESSPLEIENKKESLRSQIARTKADTTRYLNATPHATQADIDEQRNRSAAANAASKHGIPVQQWAEVVIKRFAYMDEVARAVTLEQINVLVNEMTKLGEARAVIMLDQAQSHMEEGEFDEALRCIKEVDWSKLAGIDPEAFFRKTA